MDVILIVFLVLAFVVMMLNVAYIRGRDPLKLPIEIPWPVIVVASVIGLYGIASLLFGLPSIDSFFE